MVISHFHPDHTLGFPLVIPGWPRGDKKLPVIGPIGTREYFQQLCTLVGKKHKLDRVEFFELGSGEKFKTESGKYELTSIPMKHSEESLGYLIKSKNEKTLGWTGDTAWCRGLEEMIRQADILISDMTFMGKGSKTHLGVVDDIPKYLEFLEEDQRVILTHLEDSAEKYKSLLQNSQENLIIAEEGKEFVF